MVIPCTGVLLLFSIVGGYTHLSNLVAFWPFTNFAKRRKAYVKFDRNAITMLGDTRIPWESIAFTTIARDVPAFRKRPTCLILGLSEALQRKMPSIAHRDELTELNLYVIAQQRRRGNTDISGRYTFLSLVIADLWWWPKPMSGYLTMNSAQIAELAEMYWSAAKHETAVATVVGKANYTN